MGSPTSVEPAIRAARLVVHLGKSQILHGLDMALTPGSVTGLLGPSGSGKTTLLRTLVGVQRVSSGELTLLGYPAGSTQLRRRAAYTSQRLSVYPDISVLANVTYFARLVRATSDDVASALETTGLTEFAGRRVSALSGGQASRVSLACALVGSPEVLLLDEPTVGLDPLTRESLWENFRALADDGVTLLVSSHVMDEATKCDEVLLMREGRFLAHAPIAELQRRTSTTSPEAAFLSLIRQEKAS